MINRTDVKWLIIGVVALLSYTGVMMWFASLSTRFDLPATYYPVFRPYLAR